MEEMISKEELKMIESMVDKNRLPNTFDYFLLHGFRSAMSPFNLKGKYKSTEEVYGDCLKRHVTWEELIGPMPKGVIL